MHELGNKDIDDESVPLFVTSDFHFPNINLSNLDAVNMQNQIGSLQKEVCTLQQDKITQIKSLDDAKLSIDKLTEAMLKIQSNLPAAITPTHDERTEYMPLTSSSKTASSLPVHQPISNELKLKPTVALINNDKSAPLESNLKSNDDDLKTFNYNSDWRKVNNKRRYVRAPPVGKLNSSNLKVVIRPAVVFATRFSPEITANDITKFTRQQFPELTDIKCTKLPTKFDT